MSARVLPRIWPVPIVVGGLTAVCLVVALVDDGHWDFVASLGLGAVVAYGCVVACIRKG